MCLGAQFFSRNVPFSIRRVGGRKKLKLSLIKTSLFMVGGEGSTERGTMQCPVFYSFFEVVPYGILTLYFNKLCFWIFFLFQQVIEFSVQYYSHFRIVTLSFCRKYNIWIYTSNIFNVQYFTIGLGFIQVINQWTYWENGRK